MNLIISHTVPDSEGLLRQSVYGRLAGYEDVNDAERLSRDPGWRATSARRRQDQSS